MLALVFFGRVGQSIKKLLQIKFCLLLVTCSVIVLVNFHENGHSKHREGIFERARCVDHGVDRTIFALDLDETFGALIVERIVGC